MRRLTASIPRLAASGAVVTTGALSFTLAASSARCDDGCDTPAAGWPSAAAAAGAALAAVGAASALWRRPGADMGPAVDTESWRKKWAIGQTHFHLPHLHPALERHGHLLLDDNVSAPHFPKRILFPLCGKAVDMPHLALAGHKVVGCDCVRQAADDLIAETKGAVVAGETAVGPLKVVDIAVPASVADKWGHIKFAVGDFFQFSTRVAGSFDAVFDRGSLVAIEPELRARYCTRLDEVLVPGGRILLVAVEHDAFANGTMGPPFSLPFDELPVLFPPARYTIQLLAKEDRMPLEPVWKKRGCAYFFEAAYLITKNR